MAKMIWDEIHGFSYPGEYSRFVQSIEQQLKAGFMREIDCDPDYGHGEIYGGRWFEDIESGQIWRLVPPDFPFQGLWESIKN